MVNLTVWMREAVVLEIAEGLHHAVEGGFGSGAVAVQLAEFGFVLGIYERIDL